jgi:hypothetical protein
MTTGNHQIENIIVLPMDDGRVLLPRSRTGGEWYFHLLKTTRKGDETVDDAAQRVTASRTGLAFMLEKELSRSVSYGEPLDVFNPNADKVDVTHIIVSGVVADTVDDKLDHYEWFPIDQAIEHITPIATKLVSYAKAVEVLREYPR